MSESSSPTCAVQQQEKCMNVTRYTEESGHMKLADAVAYFGLMVAVVFRVVEGTYTSKEREAITKGDMFIVYLKKAAWLLKLKSGSACVTVPVVTRTEFALTPPSEEDNEADEAVRSWEGVYHSVSEFFEARRDQDMPMPAVPAALKVLDYALDHSKKKVPPKTLLFNIRPVSQMVGLRKRCGIEGVESSGAVHRFLEGGSPVYFSTKIFDVKCSPMCFLKALRLPQTARVYQHTDMGQEEDEGVRSLQNLSIVTITEVTHDHHLVVQKLSDDGSQLGPAFTVPLSADLKVVAVKLKDSHFLDGIYDKRHVAKCKPRMEATKEETFARPLPPTPEEEHALAATSPDEEGLYEEPQQLQDCMGQMTDPTHPTITELTKVEENHGADPTMPSIPDTTMPESTADTSRDDNGYKMVGTTFLPAQEGGHYNGHNESGVAAQQVRPERLGDSHASGLSLLNKAVQRPLVRHNTAPLHRPPSPSARRRHTICKASVDDSTASRPKEPELRFHVAAKLGLDWRSVCSYLGLLHYQLDQADVAHAKLEEKAMEALVMWLQGQGTSEAPRSWSTLLQVLHGAKRSDIASNVEMGIKNKTLTVALHNYK